MSEPYDFYEITPKDVGDHIKAANTLDHEHAHPKLVMLNYPPLPYVRLGT